MKRTKERQKRGDRRPSGKTPAKRSHARHRRRLAASRNARPATRPGLSAPQPAELPSCRLARRSSAGAASGRRERLPVILETEPTRDYALLDSGSGRKLEQYGPYRIVRPEGQALWLPAWDEAEWLGADAVFTGDTDEEGMGRWLFPKEPLGETWPLAWDGIPFLGRFTSFRHVGVFPEQAAHWSFAESLLTARGAGARVLNLFGYTGIASLVAARAGAEVTHVDASKKAIAWARENQEVAGLSGCPIRWICDDATKFVQREERRGSRYDMIFLDPPAFGRGPRGEVWQLFDDLPLMVDLCRRIVGAQAARV